MFLRPSRRNQTHNFEDLGGGHRRPIWPYSKDRSTSAADLSLSFGGTAESSATTRPSVSNEGQDAHGWNRADLMYVWVRNADLPAGPLQSTEPSSPLASHLRHWLEKRLSHTSRTCYNPPRCARSHRAQTHQVDSGKRRVLFVALWDARRPSAAAARHRRAEERKMNTKRCGEGHNRRAWCAKGTERGY